MANTLNPLRGINASTEGGAGYSSIAAGRKTYGGGRPFPNVGKGGADSKAGYAAREARRRAIMNRRKQ